MSVSECELLKLWSLSSLQKTCETTFSLAAPVLWFSINDGAAQKVFLAVRPSLKPHPLSITRLNINAVPKSLQGPKFLFLTNATVTIDICIHYICQDCTLKRIRFFVPSNPNPNSVCTVVKVTAYLYKAFSKRF